MLKCKHEMFKIAKKLVDAAFLLSGVLAVISPLLAMRSIIFSLLFFCDSV